MSARLVSFLPALGLLAACGAAPSLQEIPASLPQESELASPPSEPSWTQFETCRLITLETEVLDFDAPEGSEPQWRRRELLAEYPTSPAEQQRGLQGRDPLHPDTAMLFEFPGDHNPVLWMKDTPASLDMVFFDANGEAFYLEAGTEPNSRRFLTPEEPEPIATHVLELPAGKALELGAFPGMARLSLGQAQACRTESAEQLA